MRLSIIFLLCCVVAHAQVVISGGVSIKGGVTISTGTPPPPPPPSGSISLPQVWVNTHECDSTISAPNQTIAFPAAGTGGSWAGGGPYTANSMSSLNQAVIDAEAYRNSNQSSGKVLITVPAGSLFQTAGTGLVLVQTTGDASTNCIALVTTGTLTAGQTVCAHGIQDNLPTSTDVGVRNAACTNDVGQMWTIEATANGGDAITTGAFDGNNVGPHHFLINGLEARPQAGLGGGNSIFFLVIFGNKNLNETLVSQLPSHVYLDRSWLHGDRTDSFTGSNNIQHIAVYNCNVCGFTNNQISQTVDPGTENHGVWMLQSQTVKIVHNWIEGTSINVFAGGSAISVGGSIQSANDVEIRRNRLTYPVAWLGTGSWPSQGSMIRKNCTELKSAARVLWDGNICENVDDSGAQLRVFGLNPKAQNAGSPQYFTNITDVTLSNGIFRHACNQGAQLASRSSAPPNGQGVSEGMKNLALSNDLWYDVTHPSFCSVADSNGNGFQYAFSDTTFTCSATRDGAGLTTTLSCTNSGTGMAQTDTNVGDPVTVSSCVDTTFDVGGANLGPPALTGTLHGGLTVVYQNSGTPNATTTGCKFDNFQSFPNNVQMTHNTMAINIGFGIFGSLGVSQGGFAKNNVFQDNIIGAGGIQSQGRSEFSAPPSQNYEWDPGSTVWQTNIYTGRNCSKYYDILTSGGSLVNPPTTSYCPSTNTCPTNDPTAGSCVGLVGQMNTSSFTTNPTDWHDFRLCHSGDAACLHPSLYSAGQARQASDGTDRGASFTAIDNAMTNTIYTCSSSCGAGPFTD